MNTEQRLAVIIGQLHIRVAVLESDNEQYIIKIADLEKQLADKLKSEAPSCDSMGDMTA